MFRYNGHQIEATEWNNCEPWPVKINYDGIAMKYADRWESLGGKQIIYYKTDDAITLYGVARKAFGVEEIQ